jgi:hypothetical protein
MSDTPEYFQAKGWGENASKFAASLARAFSKGGTPRARELKRTDSEKFQRLIANLKQLKQDKQTDGDYSNLNPYNQFSPEQVSAFSKERDSLYPNLETSADILSSFGFTGPSQGTILGKSSSKSSKPSMSILGGSP